VAALERALVKPDEPSEQLWLEVTKPLIQGLYPPNFGAFGIVNPAVPSKPDATTVPTTAFMVALQSQEVSATQAWLLRWREDAAMWLRETRDALALYFQRAVAATRRGTKRVLGIVAVTAALVGALWLGTQLASGPAVLEEPTPPSRRRARPTTTTANTNSPRRRAA